MNELKEYFKNNQGRLIHKWDHYFEIYERHFRKYKGKEINILEFGVFHGGSLQMWKNYFGDKATIIGVDIDKRCLALEEEKIKIIIGDQGDKRFLKKLKDSIPKIDILIDDGGHTMNQQINTFEVMYPHIDSNGIYLCEDLHTSYIYAYNGGYRKKNTYIEYSKNFIDMIHAWHSRDKQLAVNEFTKSTHSLHYYESILVIEKRPIEKPFASKTGHESF
jgi:cephalosporin hydroxylase